MNKKNSEAYDELLKFYFLYLIFFNKIKIHNYVKKKILTQKLEQGTLEPMLCIKFICLFCQC